ncbi:endonuclease/exonuclease/phosphatase (EEP) superfamily protein YafD [Chryseobacterium sediminis]|uniref:Endonuclease/exonuclease/phosphatase (EEP) superfamily protein YafD n=2 Tax=Chryseobacterium sediminis TaxID=1679494 RepID=A0ABR6Q3W8_9FLAO|nr:endonuclease/exonuclease/phosphatase (EEP) superfamily protein YafD [Chryseobacterium sediminis]
MILYILLTIFWVFSWKKRAFVFMLAGLAFINPVKRWVNYSSPKKGKSEIKIVSFNARAGFWGRKNIGSYLKSQNADVIILQEDGAGLYEFKGYQKVKPSGIFAILTKHKIINEKIIQPPNEDLRIPGILADIEINGKVYRFIDVYLNPFRFEKEMIKPSKDADTNERKIIDVVKKLIPTFKKHQEQVALIREVIENSPYPVVLAGDFNSVPNSYEYYHLSDGLEDTFLTAGKGSATSFHDYKFPIRIDYVFSSKSLKAISYEVDRSVSISDHYPVIVKFSTESK